MSRMAARLIVVLAMVAGAVAAQAAPPQAEVRLPIALGAEEKTVTVEKGDHFWKLSAARLRAELAREPTDAEIWPYWRTFIETNQGSLRSGNPDLIYPGEVLELP